MRWFYDHLARLIYVEAQSWRPTNVAMLQRYVDDQRKSHYVEGDVGEYIFPNWNVWARESALYADVSSDDSGNLYWLTPTGHEAPAFISHSPAFRLCSALERAGALSVDGARILSGVWNAVDFVMSTDWSETRTLIRQTLTALNAAGLLAADFTEDDSRVLYDWQLPMYHIDFRMIDVPLEELRREQDSILGSQY